MLIKYVYIVFVGILLAAFVGVGIAAFYKGPTAPEYPSEISYPTIEKPGQPIDATAEAKRVEMQKEHDAKFKVFQTENEIYQRNVSIIALIAAVIMLVVSLTLVKQILVIADGLLLGSINKVY